MSWTIFFGEKSSQRSTMWSGRASFVCAYVSYVSVFMSDYYEVRPSVMQVLHPQRVGRRVCVSCGAVTPRSDGCPGDASHRTCMICLLYYVMSFLSFLAVRACERAAGRGVNGSETPRGRSSGVLTEMSARPFVRSRCQMTKTDNTTRTCSSTIYPCPTQPTAASMRACTMCT